MVNASLRAKATIGEYMKCIICPLANVAGSLLLLMVTTVSAVLPDSGFYYVPAESGKGFNIEIQNSQLVIMGYLYDQSGDQFLGLLRRSNVIGQHVFRPRLQDNKWATARGCLPSPDQRPVRDGDRDVHDNDDCKYQYQRIYLRSYTFSVWN